MLERQVGRRGGLPQGTCMQPRRRSKRKKERRKEDGEERRKKKERGRNMGQTKTKKNSPLLGLVGYLTRIKHMHMVGSCCWRSSMCTCIHALAFYLGAFLMLLCPPRGGAIGDLAS